jgi:hypothetical protein
VENAGQAVAVRVELNVGRSTAQAGNRVTGWRRYYKTDFGGVRRKRADCEAGFS